MEYYQKAQTKVKALGHPDMCDFKRQLLGYAQ